MDIIGSLADDDQSLEERDAIERRYIGYLKRASRRVSFPLDFRIYRMKVLS
jgi:hypothetical protein